MQQLFAAGGLLSPSHRGSLMTTLLVTWMVMGVPAGYVSSRFCKFFRTSDRIKNTLQTAIIAPGVVFAIFFVLNMFIWGERSAGAVPFGTIVALLVSPSTLSSFTHAVCADHLAGHQLPADLLRLVSRLQRRAVLCPRQDERHPEADP